MRKMKVLLSSLLSVVALTVSAEKKYLDFPPEISLVPQAEQVTDGKRSANEDRFSVGMYGFQRLGKNGLMLPEDAFFNIATDGKTLFLSAVCPVGPNRILQRTKKGRGGERAFLDDCFEFIIATEPDSPESPLYHLILNNRGSYMTTAKRGAKNLVWGEPQYTCKGIVKDGFWTFEAALPLSQFGISEWKEGQTIGLRFVRNWRRLTKKYGGDFGCQSAWNQNFAAFFSTAELPRITLRKDAPVVRVLSLRKGKMPDVQVSVFNPGSREIELKLHYLHIPERSQSAAQETVLKLKGSETRILNLPAPQVVPGETVKTMLRLTDRTGKNVYYHRSMRWSLKTDTIFPPKDGETEKIGFQYAYYPESDRMSASIDLSAVSDLSKLQKITLELKDKSGKILASTVMPEIKNNSAQLLWAVPDLKKITRESNPSGEYTLTVTAHGLGISLIRKFERHIFAWEGNRLGKLDQIIPPFTPIKVRNNCVSTILRDHTLNDLGLWKQVNADGGNLFQGAGMTLEAGIGGKKFIAKGELKIMKSTPTKLETCSVWRAGSLQGTGSALWDYDGMMKYILTLKPGTVVDSLKLIIPLKAENAYLFHACTDGLRFNFAGKTPEKWNSGMASRQGISGSYVPYLWIGTEGRGFAIFGENDKGWVTDKKIPTQQVYRKGDTVYLIYNLISKPVKLSRERRILLGVQATPIKPMPENWRLMGFNIGADVKKHMEFCYGFLGSSYPIGGTTDSDDLFPRDFDLSLWHTMAKVRKTKQVPAGYIEKWCKGYRNSLLKKVYPGEIRYGFHVMKNSAEDSILVYTNPRGTHLDTKEAMTFLDNWFRSDYHQARQKRPQDGDHETYNVDPTPSFRDYASFWWHKMLTIGVVDHLYWDNVFLAVNHDLSGTGEAYLKDDGTFQGSVGLFNMRAMIRRGAHLVYELKKRPVRNMIHMTNTAMAPISAFAQTHLDMEESMGTTPFQRRYTKEYLRTVSIGRQFGVRPFAIGFVGKSSDPEKVRVSRRARAGVFMTHEINNAMTENIYRFGYGKPHVKIRNYWEKNYPVYCNGDTSSILMTKKGEAYLVVCNYDKKTDFTVEIDLKKAGLTEIFQATNDETGEKLAVKNNQISFTMNVYDYAVIKIKTK